MGDTLSKADCEEDQRAKVICYRPRPLMELASIKLALCIHLLELDIAILTVVPRIVRNMIEWEFESITKELKCWFEATKKFLRHLGEGDVSSRNHLVVLGGMGTVHFKATIERFLEDETLSNLAKFEMACVGCVEEKVDFFLPLLCDKLNIEEMDFNCDFMMYYWIHKKKNTLDRIPTEEFQSVEHLMIEKCKSGNNWLAIVYFLNQMNTDDQMEQINQLFYWMSPFDSYFKYSVPYFDGPWQRRFLKIAISEIVNALAQDYNTIEYAFQAWLYVKDFIILDEYLECLILPFILYGNYDITREFDNPYTDESYYEFLNSVEYPCSETLLAEMWSNTPCRLKETILERNLQRILMYISKYRGDLTKNSSRDIRFVLALLSDADPQLRNNFWRENWQKWIANVNLSQFDELTKLCLGNSKEIEEFKEIVKYAYVFREYLDTLVTRLNAQELDELIRGLFSDPDDVWIMKKVILETTGYSMREAFFGGKNYDTRFKYSEFVDYIVSNDDQAKDFKERLVSSEHTLKIFYDKLNRNDFSNIETIVELYVSSEKKVQLGKEISNFFRTRIVKGELHGFDASHWMRFLSWSLGNDELEIKMFIVSLPIGYIFQAASFLCSEDEGNSNCSLCASDDLNRFLEWYFESTSSWADYLRESVKSYREIEEAYVNNSFDV